MGLLALGLTAQNETWVDSPEQRAVEFATLPCVGIQSTSSGYVIDDELVLTVAHALHETRDFAVADGRGVWRSGDIVRLDLERDIALVRVDGLRSTPVDEAPERRVSEWPDTPVRIVGAAASGTSEASIVRRVKLLTEVVGDRSQQSSRSGYEVALEIDPGDSGAAILDDADRLVAIVFARSTARESVAWATAIDEVDRAPNEVPPLGCDDDLDIELDLTPPEPARLAG